MRTVPCVILLNAVLLLPSAAPTGQELYWLSYKRITVRGLHDAYLMQIDASGNIVRSPIRFHPQRSQDTLIGKITLSHTSAGSLTFWYPGANEMIFYGKIEVRDPWIHQKHPMGVHTYSDFIRVTDRAGSNFIAVNRITARGSTVLGYGLTPEGRWDGSRWFLFPEKFIKKDRQTGGVSRDGRFAYSVDSIHRIFLQRLKQDGRPAGVPQFLDSPSRSIRNPAPDISDELPGKKSLVVYFQQIGQREPCSISRDALMARFINGAGKALGERIELLRRDGDCSSGMEVRIDARARFIVYSDTLGGDLLLYQALDSTGRRTGSPKVLARRVAGDIDLFKSR